TGGAEYDITWRISRNVTANLVDDSGKFMTRYPRQIDRQYLSCHSRSVNKIHMIDRGTRDLYQDLVACDRGRRYFIEYQPSSVFHHSDGFHTTSLLSVSIWLSVATCPVGKLRERAAELAFQSGDIGAVADALEPFEHQRHFLAVLPDLFDGRLC